MVCHQEIGWKIVPIDNKDTVLSVKMFIHRETYC